VFRRLTLAVVVATVGVALVSVSASAHQRAPAHRAAAASTKFGIQNGCKTPLGVKKCWVAGVYNGDYSGMNDRQYTGPPAQASGGHPFVGVTDFIVANTKTITGASQPNGTVKSIRVAIPPGLVSNPQATPKCSESALTGGTCPSNTQVGVVQLEVFETAINAFVGESVYNMNPSSSHCKGYATDYSFYVALLKQQVDVCGTVNKNPPYNLYFTIQVPSGSQLVRSTLIFWGVPGDTGHNSQRGWSCVSLNVLGTCKPPASGKSNPKGKAFLTNPTGCVPKGQISKLKLTSTTNQSAFARSKTPVPAINCAKLPFGPNVNLGLSGQGETTVNKHPTLTATVTQGPGQSNIKLSTVTLPLSIALDPTNSNHVCSVKDAKADTCPASTIVGSARVKTPLLTSPLTGDVYLVQGIKIIHGHKYRTFPALLLALRGKAAIDLHAKTSVSKKSQLVTTFPGLPDLPMSAFTLTINGGKKGILVLNGNICRHAQKAGVAFTGHNGKSTQSTVTMATSACKSG
jgi:hypothetical protein